VKGRIEKEEKVRRVYKKPKERKEKEHQPKREDERGRTRTNERMNEYANAGKKKIEIGQERMNDKENAHD
jgi:hypothetical protein